MEILAAIPIILALLFWPYLTGIVAQSFGRKFWTWFFIGIPLPLVAIVVLFCLPGKRAGKKTNNDFSYTLKKIKMTNFKNQQKKLLTTDIAGKIMDPFVGLNEIHEALIRRKAEKSVKKLVKEYYSAVKFQAREVKEQIKNEKKQQQAAGLSPAGQDSETNLLAS